MVDYDEEGAGAGEVAINNNNHNQPLAELSANRENGNEQESNNKQPNDESRLSPQQTENQRSQSFDVNSPVGCNVVQTNDQRIIMAKKRRAKSEVVMTTQNALVAELKDVLRRKSKFVEVVPEHEDGAGDYAFEDEEEFQEVDLNLSDDDVHVTISPETSRQIVSSCAMTSSPTNQHVDTALAPTPQLQMCRNVRCAIVGDDSCEFFNDCQTSIGSSNFGKRTFEIRHGDQIVNVQIVAIIDNDNGEELHRFRTGYQNVDVFLSVFKDSEILRQHWLPMVSNENPSFRNIYFKHSMEPTWNQHGTKVVPSYLLL